jgi:hypothetical protein
MIAKKFEAKVNNLLKELHDREPAKKRPHVNGTIISNFFVAKDFYKKNDVCVEAIFGRFSFFNLKNNLRMHLIESQWLKNFSLHLCPKVFLPFRKQFSREILP